ncbi:MAG TPA: class I SAM-dependent methyltransferase [Candidatus Binataceae bacterium]|nr:class I SAM-dependent methyltransferase [Candidatus Binataceae bacterium]
MVSEQVFQRFYPDLRLANRGLASATAFYGWVRQYTNRNTIMLNLGAGGPAHRDKIRVFRGEVARIVGADIDPEVLKNPELDEAQVITPGSRLPFADKTFDLVLSDWVVEHVAEPGQFLGEVLRVLHSGGSFFLRTPNKHHYVGFLASITPHWFHELVANRARAMNVNDHEPWPTYYRLNSRKSIEAAGNKAGFRSVELRIWEGPPVYMVFNSVPFVLGVGYERLVNRFASFEDLRANIFARLMR